MPRRNSFGTGPLVDNGPLWISLSYTLGSFLFLLSAALGYAASIPLTATYAHLLWSNLTFLVGCIFFTVTISIEFTSATPPSFSELWPHFCPPKKVAPAVPSNLNSSIFNHDGKPTQRRVHPESKLVVEDLTKLDDELLWDSAASSEITTSGSFDLAKQEYTEKQLSAHNSSSLYLWFATFFYLVGIFFFDMEAITLLLVSAPGITLQIQTLEHATDLVSRLGIYFCSLLGSLGFLLGVIFSLCGLLKTTTLPALCRQPNFYTLFCFFWGSVAFLIGSLPGLYDLNRISIQNTCVPWLIGSALYTVGSLFMVLSTQMEVRQSESYKLQRPPSVQRAQSALGVTIV